MSRPFRYRMIKKNGDIIWVHDVGRCFTDLDGDNVTSCFVSDITAALNGTHRKRIPGLKFPGRRIFSPSSTIRFPAELSRCRSIRATALSMPTGGAWEIFGYTRDEYLQEKNDPFLHVLDRDKFWIHKRVDHLAVNGGSITYEREAVKKDGSTGWISVTIERLFNFDGIEVLQAVYSDISEVKKLQKEQEQDAPLKTVPCVPPFIRLTS